MFSTYSKSILPTIRNSIAKRANNIAVRSFSNVTPEEHANVLKALQERTGMSQKDLNETKVVGIDDDLAASLKMSMDKNEDPFDYLKNMYANDPESSKFKDTAFSDGSKPGDQPNDPTFIVDEEKRDIREDIRSSTPVETVTSDTKTMSFQTETRQMLDIVTNSLYTDKEVFLRELVSNASDALEKARYIQNSDGGIYNNNVGFEIRIFADEEKKTVTIQDTGVGMNREEIVSLLGTIAKSGSKQWVNEVKEGNSDSIIGKFGVGFYSGFMVANKIEVFSRSARLVDNAPQAGQYWVSDGTGSFEIGEADNVERGTKIILHLRDECEQFAVRRTLETILKKYSNFVGSPIYLNGVRVNVIQAIWTMSKNEVTEEQHGEFYRYISNSYDKPVFTMHFQADIPIQINALLYFPERHMEKYGMGRMDPGTSLYSRKVLIKPKAQGLLPDYLRFVQGVIDSEDIPLNISRENMQDSLLISRISSVMTKRIIKHLQEEAKKNPEAFSKWYNEFSSFIKEGVCSDFTHKGELARLLRFDSSAVREGEDPHVTLDEYLSRMPPSQQNIYYLCAPSRKIAMASPYYETLAASGHEVLFLYHPLDDFVMKNLREYSRRKLVSAETSTEATTSDDSANQLQEKHKDLVEFIKTTLGDKVSTVTLTDKNTTFPAFVVDHESASMRKMMKMMDTQGMFGDELPISKQKLNINPQHPIIMNLDKVRTIEPNFAKLVLEQVFDNALIAADILDNPRSMLPRIHKILESTLNNVVANKSGPQ